MPLQGDLKEFGVPEIFQLLEQQAKTGCLLVQGSSGEVEVYFHEGKIAGALRGGRPPSDQLLGTLETMGLLSEEEAKKIREQQKKDLRSLPEILRQSGILEIREFQVLLRERMEEILFPLFRRRTGRFSFVQGKSLPTEWNLNDPLPVEPIILEGLRQSDEWPMLKKRVGSFQEVPKRQLAFGAGKRWGSWRAWAVRQWRRMGGEGSGAAKELADVDVVPKDEPSLSSAEKIIYSRVDGRQTVGEIISSVPLGAYSASKAFLALLDRGWIRFENQETLTGKKGEAEGRTGGLIKGALSLAGLILLVLSVGLIASPQQISWVQGSFQKGLAPTFRLLNHQQRERVLKAIELYQAENGVAPPELSILVRERLLRADDLVLWGDNRFTYETDPDAEHRLLIVPSEK